MRVVFPFAIVFLFVSVVIGCQTPTGQVQKTIKPAETEKEPLTKEKAQNLINTWVEEESRIPRDLPSSNYLTINGFVIFGKTFHLDSYKQLRKYGLQIIPFLLNEVQQEMDKRNVTRKSVLLIHACYLISLKENKSRK